MKRKKIVISGINMVEGGIFTILHNALQELSNFVKNEEVEIIALVHDASKFQFSNITVIEIPLSKKSWWFRLYYEYFYFKKLSKQLQPDIWFSLHDTTPNVVAKKQFVYCHHPTTLFKPTWKDWKFDYKIGVFSVLYDFLFKINISKNHTVFVQQHWIKKVFEKRFKITNIKVAIPEYIEEISTDFFPFEPNKIHFFYPSFPRSYKNHEVILEAMKLLPKNISEQTQFHFTTIKDSKEKYAQFLVKEYGFLENVHFYGKVKRSQLLSMYKAMDCLLFPSKIETWGLPISEAKAYKKPMFLANLPYAKEACGNYEKVSFFDENNATELAKLITEFVEEKLMFQGNTSPFDTSKDLHNWKKVFQYILTD
ncbi:glycosyltransferase [Flavobacterium sp.]|uniref:glycosyltransferase n=1 Tax=Flavobacterium sp. TaxID=239 RepID=UPI00334271F7